MQKREIELVIEHDVECTKFPNEGDIELTEKGEKIGSLVEKAEKEMEEEK